ncbi:MAG: phosphonate metabolism protein/1,5-bisphosphokinase (PRPP-forming) PhnN [Pseudomonadota bacterium]
MAADAILKVRPMDATRSEAAANPSPPDGEDSDATPQGIGVLFLVVGPSGVGKDTLLDGAHAELAQDDAFVFARRVITRPADAGGEAHEAVTPEVFKDAEARGEFLVSWHAHGIAYGVRRTIHDDLLAGRNVLVNGSRGEIAAFARAWDRLVVVSITAPPDVVERRLKQRGREDGADVAARLARAVPIRGAKHVVEIVNDRDVETGVSRLLSEILGAAYLP